MRPEHDEEQFRAEAGITIAMREEQRRLSGGPDRCTRMNSDGAISCPPTFASARAPLMNGITRAVSEVHGVAGDERPL